MLPPAARRITKAVWVKRRPLRVLCGQRCITSGAPPWRPAAVLDEYAKHIIHLQGILLIGRLVKMGSARGEADQSPSIDLFWSHLD